MWGGGGDGADKFLVESRPKKRTLVPYEASPKIAFTSSNNMLWLVFVKSISQYVDAGSTRDSRNNFKRIIIARITSAFYLFTLFFSKKGEKCFLTA